MATNRVNYPEEIEALLGSNMLPVDVQLLLDALPGSTTTIKKYLKIYLDQNPERIGSIIGLYPSSDTVIRLAEQHLGAVTGENLYEINQECKRIIDRITKPKHKQFLENFLNDFMEVDGQTLRLGKDILVDYLYDEYIGFVHEADNGLVSIAGSMNEKILIRGLVVNGLVEGRDFKKTGRDSEADLQIEHRGRTTRILYCEIKSYAARERLLRGLRDIQQPDKIGVGFFNNPAEFNPDRTQTLLQAGPSAIYMPDVTLDQVHADSKRQTTVRQDALYRPLSHFISDMQLFANTGNLPRYP